MEDSANCWILISIISSIRCTHASAVIAGGREQITGHEVRVAGLRKADSE
jgi:hypothetical protein